MTSFLRPVARTALRKFGSDHAAVVVRSIGVRSGKMSWISLKIGSARTPPRADTVVSTVGTPTAFAARAAAVTLLTRCRLSVSRVKVSQGWWSMSTRAEFSIVSSVGSVISLSIRDVSLNAACLRPEVVERGGQLVKTVWVSRNASSP